MSRVKKKWSRSWCKAKKKRTTKSIAVNKKREMYVRSMLKSTTNYDHTLMRGDNFRVKLIFVYNALHNYDSWPTSISNCYTFFRDESSRRMYGVRGYDISNEVPINTDPIFYTLILQLFNYTLSGSEWFFWKYWEFKY